MNIPGSKLSISHFTNATLSSNLQISTKPTRKMRGTILEHYFDNSKAEGYSAHITVIFISIKGILTLILVETNMKNSP